MQLREPGLKGGVLGSVRARFFSSVRPRPLPAGGALSPALPQGTPVFLSLPPPPLGCGRRGKPEGRSGCWGGVRKGRGI